MAPSKTTKKTNKSIKDALFRVVAHKDSDGTLEAQLLSLYEDREKLQDELGVSSPEDIIKMIRSMENQLRALYEERMNS